MPLTHYFLQLVNFSAATREAIREGKALARQAQREAEGARARAEAAEQALELARAERAEEARAAKARAETEAQRLHAALEQLMGAESAIEARNLQISELDAALRASEERARRAEEEAARAWEVGEAKAAEAEATFEARVAKAVEEVRASEEFTAEVEASLKDRAARAVEEFRASEEFAAEVIEAGAGFYIDGFREAREKVARVFDLPGALAIVPDEESAEAPPVGGPATDP